MTDAGLLFVALALFFGLKCTGEGLIEIARELRKFRTIEINSRTIYEPPSTSVSERRL